MTVCAWMHGVQGPTRDALMMDATHAKEVHMARAVGMLHGRWRHCARSAVIGVGIRSVSMYLVGVVTSNASSADAAVRCEGGF